jgi:histidinol-phosphate phosphatase family protein
MRPSFDIVVPTIGRPSLSALLAALAASRGQTPVHLSPGRVLIVYDGDSEGELPQVDGLATEVLLAHGRGPAAARNVGWRASRAEWISFLDDDVVPEPDWLERLGDDLTALPADVAGSQGRVVVPLPADRRPIDWERNVAGLERARWATADMAYRRRVLAEVGGFDERFRRAYREDADLALRVERAGHRLVRGSRSINHPVSPGARWASVRLQAGNADDALMAALHGRDWRRRAGEPRGRRARHLAVTAAGLVALAGFAAGRRRLAAAGVAAWLAGTGELAWARIAPGPRTAGEVATMTVTSAVLPVAASLQWLRGLVRARRVVAAARAPRPDAVLFDRDGTLVVDVPYNGDPERVVPMPGAREALERLRDAGVPVGVVSNQSGVARGLLTMEQVEGVNRRIEELLGPLGPWVVCPHGPDDSCGCRKPSTGLIEQAAASLGVEPSKCAVVGDIGSDVEAARAAGARAVLVPTPRTRLEEVAAAPEVVDDLASAVDLLLRGGP